MSTDLAQARASILSISQSLKESNVEQALTSLAAGIDIYMRNKLFRTEKEELEKMLTKAFYRLNVDPEFKRLYPRPVVYTPGQERELVALLKRMGAELKAKQEEMDRIKCAAEDEKRSKFVQKGLEFVQTGEIKRAVLLFRRMLAECPPTGAQLTQIGNAFLAGEHYTFAFEFLDLASREFPQDVKLHTQLASILRKLRKYDEAQACYQQALEIEGNNEVIWFNLGRLLIDMRRWQDAHNAAKKVLEIKPDFQMGQKLLEHIEKKLFG